MTDLFLETPLTLAQRRYALMLQQSAKALLELLNDILDFSKIEAGKLDLELIDFDLHDPSGRYRRRLGCTRIGKKEWKVLCSIAPDVPSSLFGDPGRLRQILNNLAGNAVKFHRRRRGRNRRRVAEVPRTKSPQRSRSASGIRVSAFRRRIGTCSSRSSASSTRQTPGSTGAADSDSPYRNSWSG